MLEFEKRKRFLVLLTVTSWGPETLARIGKKKTLVFCPFSFILKFGHWTVHVIHNSREQLKNILRKSSLMFFL